MPFLGAGGAPSDAGTATMLDDSLGALTQSVYDATAATQQTFEKLIPKLQEYQTQESLFSSNLSTYEKDLLSALKASSFQLKRALMESTSITNGISDVAANKVIHAMIRHMNKANVAVIKAIEKKDMMRFSLESQPKILGALSRNIQSKIQRSFSQMSVADKVAQNAKTLQSISKNIVEKAERAHLGKTSPALHEGVAKIKEIIEIEKRIIPYRPVSAKDLIPQTIDNDLGASYVSTSNAVGHAENALSLSGSARAREIVDLRDQLRNALDTESDALRTKTQVTDVGIEDKIVPFNSLVRKVVTEKIVPSLQSYSENNRKIIEQVDRSRVHDIMYRLSKQVTKQSAVPGFIVGTTAYFSRKSIFSNFF